MEGTKMSNEEDFDRLYGSAYLKASDLDASAVIKRRITKVTLEALRQMDGETKEKLIVSFAGLDQILPLNKGNARSLASKFGKDWSKWPGAMVELSVIDTSTGPGVCVKPIVNGKAADDLNDDDIGF
jgi:hypothetical protein